MEINAQVRRLLARDICFSSLSKITLALLCSSDSTDQYLGAVAGLRFNGQFYNLYYTGMHLIRLLCRDA